MIIMQCLPNALDQKIILSHTNRALRRSHNLSMLKSSNMLAQALAALMANDVSASQQSCCSFDGTAFLIRALGLPMQVCKDRGEVHSYTIDF